MKKLFILCILATLISHVAAQKWKNYFQLGVGTGYLMNADTKDTPFLQFEYGKTYKWLDVGVALEYANSSTYNNKYNSLVLKTKLDIIRMLCENSRHSFKCGIGTGIGFRNVNNWYESTYTQPQENNSSVYRLHSVSASYEYQIVDNISVGTFFNNYTGESFFGLHYLGLSARYNF